ncbi:MAG: peptidylprolyl isomerase, partial [Candidatus Parcubacteria bacterium]|nr:peptidylprolyl isomerase [Candidatus Parcubacteria bacterium]
MDKKILMNVMLSIIFIVLAGTAGYFLFRQKPKVEQNNNVSNVNNAIIKNMIILETSLGNIKIKLDYDSAPETSANFEKLVTEKFYDNLTFHRIVPGFVIQGGDPKGDGTGGPG